MSSPASSCTTCSLSANKSMRRAVSSFRATSGEWWFSSSVRVTSKSDVVVVLAFRSLANDWIVKVELLRHHVGTARRRGFLDSVPVHGDVDKNSGCVNVFSFSSLTAALNCIASSHRTNEPERRWMIEDSPPLPPS